MPDSAKIEVVQFAADRAGDVQEARIFSGTLADQLRDCLKYLGNFSAVHVQKQRDRSQVRRWVSYPMQALRETLVNAAYHRSYDVDQPEPTKVHLYPDRIEIISYPGPVAGIEARHLLPKAKVPAVPARNSRIGEFLKGLGLADGRLTGLLKAFQAMENNGSPSLRFDFDEQRTYFRATLPAHPEFVALSALRDAAHLRVLGERREALHRLEAAWRSNPTSPVLASETMRAHAKSGELERAEEVLRIFEAQGPESAVAYVTNTMIEVLANAGNEKRARQLLRKSRPMLLGRNAIDAAVLARRVRDSGAAHRYFELTGDAVYVDPRALLEFAQTKLWLANKAHRENQRDSSRRFLMEARDLLERVIQLDASPARHAWAWRELARARNWLRAPISDVEEAYLRAIELLPNEQRFRREMERAMTAR